MMKNNIMKKIMFYISFSLICSCFSLSRERSVEDIFLYIKKSYRYCVLEKIDNSNSGMAQVTERSILIEALEDEFSFFKIKEVVPVVDSLKSDVSFRKDDVSILIVLSYPGPGFNPEVGYETIFYLLYDDHVFSMGYYDCDSQKVMVNYISIEDAQKRLISIRNETVEGWGPGYLFFLEFTYDWRFIECEMFLGVGQ